MARRRRAAPGASAPWLRPRQRSVAGHQRVHSGVLVAAGFGGAVILATIALVGAFGGESGRPTPGRDANALPPPGVPTADPEGNYPHIAGLACDPQDHSAHRLHAHIELRFGGEVRAVAPNIGVRDTCRYWVTTRQADGVFHFHSPIDRPLNLGDAFDVWGEVLTERQVLDRVLAATEGVYVIINGRRRDGDPRAIILNDLDAVEVQVGTGPFQPLAYEFPGSLD